MTDFKIFMPLSKVEKKADGTCIVSGYASTPSEDNDGEIITLGAIKKALPGYMRWNNIREMHRLSAVGKAQEANVDTKGLFLTAKIVDASAVKKCVEGVYKGFSIGGRKLDKVGNTITEIDMTEISIVDRPANPDCSFTLAKSQKTVATKDVGYLIKEKSDPKDRALIKMAKAVDILAKNNNPPAAHDGFSLPAPVKKQENAVVESHACTEHGVENCDKCTVAKKDEKKEPYGDVEYADNGLQSDGKKRYPIDTPEHIRAAWNYINKPKNAAKYGENAPKVKAKIISAWKSKIDKSGPPSAEKVKKTIETIPQLTVNEDVGFLNLGKTVANTPAAFSADLYPPFLDLKKSMSAAGSLSYCFDTIRSVQRALMMEAKREGGDLKDKSLAKELGVVAQKLASVIGQKASHEGSEALDLSDADDLYVKENLGKDFMMSETTDDLTKVLGALLEKVGTQKITKAQRMKMADDNMKKARDAKKEAMKAVEECHKMHKAAYLAKLAKAAKKKPDDDDDDDDDFDHQAAMEKMQKAYNEMQKVGTFVKAARGQLEKAARSGQRGQETGDGNEFYEVPAGVKDLTPAALAGAAPGTKSGGSQSPMYPVDGNVYAGKAEDIYDLAKYAKNGQVPVEIAQLLAKSAQTEGELQALRNMPVSNGRRPYSFDMTKIVGGTTSRENVKAASDVLFKGVDTNALSSGNEIEQAKVIGNLLLAPQFGKSILDPSFNGAAGN